MLRRGAASRSYAAQAVSELVFFCLEVCSVLLVWPHFEGNTLRDRNAAFRHLPLFFRIIREKAHFTETQIFQNVRRRFVCARICGKSECFVRLHRIESFVLQGVRAYLVRKSDAAPLLTRIYNDAGTLLFDTAHALLKLCAAVAAERKERIASETLRMDAHERSRAWLPENERRVLAAVQN